MEDKQINITRLEAGVSYPCNFTTIASMNPCPCGYYGSKIKDCICTENQRQNYRAKLSGPLIDRFDLQVQVSSIDYSKLREKHVESSVSIKKRVNKAREIQSNRYKNEKIYSNSELTAKMLEKYCFLDSKIFKVLQEYLELYKLSNRAYSKILKVARTIADLEGEEKISLEHILEAMQYRILDKE